MVFELTDELARCPQSKRGALTVCISNLLLGYYEGNLYLTASSALCGFISANHLVEGVRQNAALNHLLNNNGYCPNVLWHIKVVLENADVENHELDISFFGKTESIQPTSMLCENLQEIHFYSKQARYYHPLSPMRVNKRHGGGGTTVDVFKDIKRHNLVCLVLLDSDVKYPGCSMGDTARRCVHNYQSKLANIEVKVLPVHEAENLVPVSFMLSNSCSRGVQLLKRLEKRGVLDCLVYYDVKEGITKEKAMESKKYKEFARFIFQKTNPRNPNGFDAYFDLKDDKDFLYSKLNPDMLSLFIQDKSTSYQHDELDVYRKEIADLVYTFLCCRGTDPIN